MTPSIFFQNRMRSHGVFSLSMMLFHRRFRPPSIQRSLPRSVLRTTREFILPCIPVLHHRTLSDRPLQIGPFLFKQDPRPHRNPNGLADDVGADRVACTQRHWEPARAQTADEEAHAQAISQADAQAHRWVAPSS